VLRTCCFLCVRVISALQLTKNETNPIAKNQKRAAQCLVRMQRANGADFDFFLTYPTIYVCLSPLLESIVCCKRTQHNVASAGDWAQAGAAGIFNGKNTK
jgi:hypothetical protein